ncbi:subtilisin-like protein [Bimuria novae-zelandiae CBS 107.79]|uniref:Subtilisin-like protein n=1 Tax=Bimuria novae-zelandiae CBS 107.79 TaxID=1447943 RepID=A0A6A5VPK5_9PLEO|nr:subtilisin-like protein [Bimuria novae-zelandiae CBS 107.79]
MVQRWPALLEAVNKDEHNPLFMAIRNSQPQLIDYMISACGDSNCLDSALRKQVQGRKTCIHIALKEKLNLDTTKKLIECASDEALAVQDSLGMTPMHYAVSFEKCTDAGTELITLFIDRDQANQARQKGTRLQSTFLDLRDNENRSVQNTARFDSNTEQVKGKEMAPPAMRPPVPRRHSNAEAQMAKRLRNSNAVLLRLKQHYMRTRGAEMVIAFLYGNNMDDIQISFDYDQLPREMVWNDFVEKFGADEKMGLKFDRVLQYVTFPQVEVIHKGTCSIFFDWLYKKGVRHIIRVSVQDSGGSRERVHSDRAIQESLEKFIIERLDWQKMDLDPETILHISSKVEREAPTGSNAVLRAWSEPEGLAMLPYLEEIFLFNPPDDKMYERESWITDRIAKFQERLNKSRPAARARAQKELQSDPAGCSILGPFKDVTVKRPDSSLEEERNVTSYDAPYLTPSALGKGINSHKWLDSTKRFTNQMIGFWESTVKDYLDSRQNLPKPKGLEDDVVLALIDDGVARFDIHQTNQILEGKNFDFHNGKVRPPFSSANGHGTVMASVILEVCPMVKIYPIRLKTYPNAGEKNMRIDARYAAQALQATLDKKATIISMSWTIPMNSGESEAKKQLHKVLKKAVDNKVLMFCSTPDSGKFTDVDYPSGPWRDRFFRIGAANADGTVFQWTPEDGITYVLPGVDVVRQQKANSSSDAKSTRGILHHMVEFHETGSSVATALAAGLAAMIIYCVKVSILAVKTANNKNIHVPGTFPDSAAQQIAHPDEMKRALASLALSHKISELLEASQASNSSAEAKKKCIDSFVEFGQRLFRLTPEHKGG